MDHDMNTTPMNLSTKLWRVLLTSALLAFAVACTDEPDLAPAPGDPPVVAGTDREESMDGLELDGCVVEVLYVSKPIWESSAVSPRLKVSDVFDLRGA